MPGLLFAVQLALLSLVGYSFNDYVIVRNHFILR
jgi:preprotein translocase subunit SecF